MTTVDRTAVLRYRFARHQLDREPGRVTNVADVALLDLGVQDSGPDGAAWALACRGYDGGFGGRGRDVAIAWTLRGAPHAYRRADLAAVATATAPLSEADAAKRMYDAAKPLKAAGIGVLDALDVVAGHMREIVARPTSKGDLSSALTGALDDPYLRTCVPCHATHTFEMPFRLAALQAGLELEPGTSPPVLRRIPKMRAPRYRHLGGDADPRFDVIRRQLAFYGPISVKEVAAFVDATVKDVEAHWPDDAVEVTVRGAAKGSRFVLAEDVDALTGAGRAAPVVRLLGPFDGYLQLRDRELLVADGAHRKDLWRTLGRPGAIVDGGEVVGTWRPRQSGSKLTVAVDPWVALTPTVRRRVDDEAERLATHRGVAFAGVAVG
ncbi:MAG: crosslink repair DNA glycosylase YcaQ family protein [Ilumatobacteraceae bacterium]